MRALLCSFGRHVWSAHYSPTRGRYLVCSVCKQTATPPARADDALDHELARHVGTAA
jgi:hypothetical protein